MRRGSRTSPADASEKIPTAGARRRRRRLRGWSCGFTYQDPCLLRRIPGVDVRHGICRDFWKESQTEP